MTAQLPSRERLEALASGNAFTCVQDDEAAAMARALLAAHEQEPVGLTFTTEHRRVIEMLLNVCGAAFELADDGCQQEVDGESCHVIPDASFVKLSDALDEIENSLPTEDAARPDVFLGWAAMPRAALKSLLHTAPVPAVQDNWKGQLTGTQCTPESVSKLSTGTSVGVAIVPAVPDEIVGWVREENGDSRDPLFLCGSVSPYEGKAYNSQYFPVKRAAMLNGGKS